MEALGIEGKLLLGQIVNFVILFLILGKFLYKPLMKMLDDRRNKIAESIENNKKIEESLAKTEERVAEIIKVAEEKSAKIIEEGAKAATLQKEEIMALAKSQSEQEIAKAKIAIAQDKDAAKKELEKEIIGLVGLASEIILKEKVSPEMQKTALARASKEYK